MRWFWIDRFTSFRSGESAEAIKNVTLSDEVLDDYQNCFAVLPCSVMIEGLAQAGGILVAERFRFEKRVVLAKIGAAEFHHPARPGDTLRYHVELDGVQNDGAMVRGTIYVAGTLLGEAQLMFAFLDEQRFIPGDLFEPGDLLAMLQSMGLYDCAVDAQGEPLTIAPRLLDGAPATMLEGDD